MDPREVSRRGHSISVPIPTDTSLSNNNARKNNTGPVPNRRAHHHVNTRGPNKVVERVVIVLVTIGFILFGLSKMVSSTISTEDTTKSPDVGTLKAVEEVDQLAVPTLAGPPPSRDSEVLAKLRNALAALRRPTKTNNEGEAPERTNRAHHQPHLPAGPRDFEEQRDRLRQKAKLARDRLAHQEQFESGGESVTGENITHKKELEDVPEIAKLLKTEAHNEKPFNMNHLFVHRPSGMSSEEFIDLLNEAKQKLQSRLDATEPLSKEERDGLVKRLWAADLALEREKEIFGANNKGAAKIIKGDAPTSLVTEESVRETRASKLQKNNHEYMRPQEEEEGSTIEPGDEFTNFVKELNLTEMLAKRYSIIDAFTGSHRKPRRLVLFSTLKPCYDASIRFAQLDAVRSWVSMPMAQRPTAPYAHDPNFEPLFYTSVVAANGTLSRIQSSNDTMEGRGSRSVAPSSSPAPSPVTVYLIVGGTDEMDAAQKAAMVEETEDEGMNDAENEDSRKEKKNRNKHPLDASMTEGQCSQWIADTINRDYAQVPYYRRQSQLNQIPRRGSTSYSPPGPVVVIPRSKAPRGKSGTVLFGASIYKVTDIAVRDEQRILASEANGVLTRAVLAQWEQQHLKGSDNSIAGDTAKRKTGQPVDDADGDKEVLQLLGGQGVHGARGAPQAKNQVDAKVENNRDVSYAINDEVKRKIQSTVSAFVSQVPFSVKANRIMFGFINGDILLDPLSSVALSRIQDVFKTVFIVGKRRSVKIKLKQRVSAIKEGVVKAPSASDSIKDNVEDNAEGEDVRKQHHSLKSTYDFSTAGWELAKTFAQSEADRSDAEDFFLWSGDFFASITTDKAASSSVSSSSLAIDNMAFIPNFHIGRPAFDNWFLNKALQTLLPVVDSSEMLLAYHQVHDYKHLKEKKNKEKKRIKFEDDDDPKEVQHDKKDGSYWGREESEENRELALANGGWQFGTLDFVPIRFGRPTVDIDGQNDEDSDGALPQCARALRASAIHLTAPTSSKKGAFSQFTNDIGERSLSASTSDPSENRPITRGVSLFSAYQHMASNNKLVTVNTPSNNSTSGPYVGTFVPGKDPMWLGDEELGPIIHTCVDKSENKRQEKDEEMNPSDEDNNKKEEDTLRQLDCGRSLEEVDLPGHTYSSAFAPSQECQLHQRPDWGPFDQYFQGDRLASWKSYYSHTHNHVRRQIDNAWTRAVLALLGEADVAPKLQAIT